MEDQNQVYTLMVIPHSDSPTVSYQFPLKLVKLVGFFAVVLACLCLVFTYQYQQARMAAKELEVMTEEYHEQQQKILHLAQQAEQLQKDMVAVRELDETVRNMMHLAPKESDNKSEEVNPQPDFQRLAMASRGGLSATLLRTEENLQTVRELLPASQNNLAKLTKTIAAEQAKAERTPSIWPTHGRLTSRFGYRLSPFGRGRQFHAGIDLGAARGTPICATAKGTVQFAGYQSGYGYVVYINHGYGFTTVYAHMSKLGTRAGKTVGKGEVIGYVGNSGWSTGPHLHYEVRVNGKPVNPLNYLGK